MEVCSPHVHHIRPIAKHKANEYEVYYREIMSSLLTIAKSPQTPAHTKCLNLHGTVEGFTQIALLSKQHVLQSDEDECVSFVDDNGKAISYEEWLALDTEWM
jgi:hypothetical protein